MASYWPTCGFWHLPATSDTSSGRFNCYLKWVILGKGEIRVLGNSERVNWGRRSYAGFYFLFYFVFLSIDRVNIRVDLGICLVNGSGQRVMVYWTGFR